ncbi:MAG: hypothetical protein U0941_29070 [Planctomycetaceae bacterium]
MLNVDCPSSRTQGPKGVCLDGHPAIGWRSLDQYRPHLICVMVMATLSCLLGCGQVHSRPVRSPVARDSPVAGNPTPKPNTPPAKSDRVISIHGLDTEYHGSSAILPDNRLDHQKGSHD